MQLQPLKACLVLLALGGCATVEDRASAPPLSSLYSEYRYQDVDVSFYAPFLLATEAQHSESHSKSASYYLQALSMDPDSKFVADRAFFQLLFAGRMDEAALVADKIMHTEGLDSEDEDLVRLVHVLDAFKNEDWKEVVKRLDKPMGTGFGYILSPLIKAWALGADGREYGDILAALTPLIDEDRVNTIGVEHFAYILDYMGDYEAAEKQYKAIAEKFEPFSLQPYISYTAMLYKLGRIEDARAFLTAQTERFQNHAFLLREGARVMTGQPSSHEANTPRGAMSMVFYRLANEFAKGGSDQTAVVYLQIAAYLTPELADIYFSLGSILDKMGKTEGAEAAFKAVPPQSPLKAIAELRRIEVLKSADRMAEAETLLRDALSARPKQYDFLVSMADLLQRQEKFSASLEYYNKALLQLKQPTAEDWHVFFARGIAYERTGNWPLAEKDLKIALNLSGGQPSVLNYLGYSWIDRGENVEEAKKMIERAVAARPDDGFIVDSLGWVHYLTGDYEKAVEALEKAVRLEPDDSTINEHLGDAYWRVGRKVEARFQWRHALEGTLTADKRAEIERKIDIGLPDVERVKAGEKAS